LSEKQARALSPSFGLAYNHSLQHYSPVCCFLQRICSKRPALVAAFAILAESGDRPFRTPSSSLFRLNNRVEIRHRQNFIEIRNPLTAADTRDYIARMWQLPGCCVESAGLSAAFGSVDTPCSIGPAYTRQ
jgi:hypothetical protein